MRKRSPYKCIQPMLPRAENAVFDTMEDGKLNFTGWEKDEALPPTASGYVTGYNGDSGGPFWTKSIFKTKKLFKEPQKEDQERQTIVAVFSSSPNSSPAYSSLVEKQCRMIATKISSNIIRWIKDITDIK